jgi:hypothetical protein
MSNAQRHRPVIGDPVRFRDDFGTELFGHVESLSTIVHGDVVLTTYAIRTVYGVFNLPAQALSRPDSGPHPVLALFDEMGFKR